MHWIVGLYGLLLRVGPASCGIRGFAMDEFAAAGAVVQIDWGEQTRTGRFQVEPPRAAKEECQLSSPYGMLRRMNGNMVTPVGL